MESFTEKHRPKTFDKIKGQDKAIKTIEALLGNNMPHMVFYGPPGTGKTTTALTIARKLYPKSLRDNMLELNASDKRGIGMVREKIKTFARRPVERKDGDIKFKLIILDEADSMTKDAQNALRRIIEMNSNSTRFIFVCNYIGRLIPAIISRCSPMKFASISKIDSLLYLAEIFENELPTEQTPLKETIGILRNCLTDHKETNTDSTNFETLFKTHGNERKELVVMMRFFVKIYEDAAGDLRKSINKLEEIVKFNIDTLNEIEEMIEFERKDKEELNGVASSFYTCFKRKEMIECYKIISDYEMTGKSFRNLINSIANGIVSDKNLTEDMVEKLCIKLCELDRNIACGANGKMQLMSFFSYNNYLLQNLS